MVAIDNGQDSGAIYRFTLPLVEEYDTFGSVIGAGHFPGQAEKIANDPNSWIPGESKVSVKHKDDPEWELTQGLLAHWKSTNTMYSDGGVPYAPSTISILGKSASPHSIVGGGMYAHTALYAVENDCIYSFYAVDGRTSTKWDDYPNISVIDYLVIKQYKDRTIVWQKLITAENLYINDTHPLLITDVVNVTDGDITFLCGDSIGALFTLYGKGNVSYRGMYSSVVAYAEEDMHIASIGQNYRDGFLCMFRDHVDYNKYILEYVVNYSNNTQSTFKITFPGDFTPNADGSVYPSSNVTIGKKDPHTFYVTHLDMIFKYVCTGVKPYLVWAVRTNVHPCSLVEDAQGAIVFYGRQLVGDNEYDISAGWSDYWSTYFSDIPYMSMYAEGSGVHKLTFYTEVVDIPEVGQQIVWSYNLLWVQSGFSMGMSNDTQANNYTVPNLFTP